MTQGEDVPLHSPFKVGLDRPPVILVRYARFFRPKRFSSPLILRRSAQIRLFVGPGTRIGENTSV